MSFRLDVFLRVIIGAFGVAALLLYFYQIVSTWAFHDYSISWGAEMSIYLLVWAMFLACSELVRVDSHIRADFLISHLSVRTQRWLELVNCLVGIIFGLGLIWYGWQATFDAWDLDERSTTALMFPMWLYYASAPAGGVLIVLRYVERFGRYAIAFDEQTMALHSAAEV